MSIWKKKLKKSQEKSLEFQLRKVKFLKKEIPRSSICANNRQENCIQRDHNRCKGEFSMDFK